MSHHESMRDTFLTWGLAAGGYLVSIGHVVQGVVSVAMAVAAITSAYIQLRRFLWDDKARRQAVSK